MTKTTFPELMQRVLENAYDDWRGDTGEHDQTKAGRLARIFIDSGWSNNGVTHQQGGKVHGFIDPREPGALALLHGTDGHAQQPVGAQACAFRASAVGRRCRRPLNQRNLFESISRYATACSASPLRCS